MTLATCLSGSVQSPIAYTDGACLGNPGPGGWGIRIYTPAGTILEHGGSAPATTNNRMELQAAIEALKIIGESTQATIFTDSRYVIDGITKWLAGWRRRGWVTKAETPVKNQELWITLDQYQHRGIAWRHVRGHSGDPNNERVDTIARTFAAGEVPQLFSGPCGSPLDPVQPQERPEQVPDEAEHPTSPRLPLGNEVSYISIVQGVPRLHKTWAECAARVHRVSGARYKKVRTAEELQDFCKQHGVPPPAAK